TYKSPELFDVRYGRAPNRNGEDPARCHSQRFNVAGYLDYQGEIFVRRFDANSYLVVTKAQDTWDLGRTPEEEVANLALVRGRVMLVGIASDWLFPPAHVKGLAERLRAAGVRTRHLEQPSAHGHDGFLADADHLAGPIAEALAEPE